MGRAPVGHAGKVAPGGTAPTGPAEETQVGWMLFARFHWLFTLRGYALLFGYYPFPHSLLTGVT